jgi:cytochrome c553
MKSTRTMIQSVAVLLLAFPAAGVADDNAARAEHFEIHVRPILATHCFQCHGPSKQKGGLRLDQRATALAGGDTGKAIVPGRVDEGELLKAIKYDPDGYRMPPSGKLPRQAIIEFEKWVRDGAYWPEEKSAANSADHSTNPGWLEERRKAHWCWQPVENKPTPRVQQSDWPAGDVDAFLRQKMDDAKLSPAKDADRYTLLRRLHFLIVGLPPTPEELEEFAADDDPFAVERVVDRLLASSAFGERWARHWLDLVRFSETLGHEFDFDIPNAWRYRDYVMRALNADLPYDQFIVEHIAGDLLAKPRLDARQKINESINAPAFWWFGEAKQAPVDVRAEQADHIDNQIDVFGKTFLGLTVSCARCHDHKFDAISARDYYSLYGFLKSTRYTQASIVPESRWREEIAARSRIEQEIRRLVGEAWKSQIRELPSRLSKADCDAILKEVGQVSEPLASQKDQSRILGDIADGFRGWRRNGPAATFAEAQLGDPIIGDSAARPIESLHDASAFHSGRWGRRFQGTFRSLTFRIDQPKLHVKAGGKGARFNVVVENFNVIRAPIYGGLKVKLEKGDVAWRTVDLSAWIGREAYIEFLDQTVADLGDPDRAAYPADAWFTVEQVLLNNGAAPLERLTPSSMKTATRKSEFDAPDESTVEESPFERLQRLAADALAHWRSGESLTSGDVKLLNLLIDRQALRAPAGKATQRVGELLAERARVDAMMPSYDPVPTAEDGDGRDEAVFIRGNSKKLGATAPRRFLEAIDGETSLSIGDGSGRLQLARRLVDRKNPLVARVFVNRIWRHVFGRGLVESPDNFGVLGESPTHRELLDHLTDDFIRDGWSLKRLVRRLVTTRAFRLSSIVSAEAKSLDPQNKLFARANVNRLEAEALRDALLATSGRRKSTMFGPGVLVHLDAFSEGRGKPKSGPIDGDNRRTIYLTFRRNFPSSLLSAFDTPLPAGTVGKRSVSNVPAQALILLNDPFVVQRARLFAQDLLSRHPNDVDARIRRLYLTAFGRPALTDEIQSARDFLKSQATVRGKPEGDIDVWCDLCHAIYNAKEFLFLQ